MSFVKHALFFPKDAPQLRNYDEIVKFIANRLKAEHLLISEGVLDALDHSSDSFAYGGKLGIDLTDAKPYNADFEDISDEDAATILGAKEAKIYLKDTPNRVLSAKINRVTNAKEIFEKTKSELSKYAKIVVIFDEENNDLGNPYMLFWRLLNNMDAKRDIYIDGEFIFVDATKKCKKDGFEREWPNDTVCEREILDSLKSKSIIDFDEEFLRKWQIVDFD